MWVNLSCWGQTDRCCLLSQASNDTIIITIAHRMQQSPVYVYLILFHIYPISDSIHIVIRHRLILSSHVIKHGSEMGQTIHKGVQSKSRFKKKKVYQHLLQKFEIVLFSHSWTINMTAVKGIASKWQSGKKTPNGICFQWSDYLKLYKLKQILAKHIHRSWQSCSVCPRSCLPVQPALLPLAILNGSRGWSRGHFDSPHPLKSCFTFPIWI